MKKFTIFMIVIDVIVAMCFVVVYFVKDFKYTVISSLLGTMDHQWIAYTFYSDKTINEVRTAETIIPFDEDTDLSAITIDSTKKDNFDNEYDEQILTRDENNDLYKLLNIKIAGKYDALLLAIYDPTKVKLMHIKQFNVRPYGEQVVTMAKRYGAIGGINAGGFVDYGTGSDIPMGYVIKDSKVIWSDGPGKGNIIGMTKEGKLLLTNSTGEEAINMGVIDGIEFGPFLIVNGKSMKYTNETTSGYARAPRVVIAQRKDGVMLFLTTKGTIGYTGPTFGELTDILLKYGAYNAANLDGGASTTMVLNGKTINNPVNAYGSSLGAGRYIVTAWGLFN